MTAYSVSGRDAGDFPQGRIAWPLINLACRAKVQRFESVDCRGLELIRPYGVACLCASAAVMGNRPRLKLPDTGAAAPYLRRLRLDRWFELDPPPTTSEAIARDVVVRQLVDRPGAFSSEVVHTLAAAASASAGLIPRLADHIDEMIMNALTHSGSSVGCFVAAQVFPARAVMEVAVLDLGDTIRGHLSRRSEYAGLPGDYEAILRATEEGVTGTVGLNRFHEPNSGIGLYELRAYCEAGHGSLSVLSGRSMVTFSVEDRAAPFHLNEEFPGTLVNIRFNLDTPRTPYPSS